MKTTLLIACSLLTIVLVIYIARWPFRRAATIESLERISSSDVRIARYQKTFFPHPGYIAENVTFTRGDETHPLVTVGKVTCQASWLALVTFTHRIKRIDLESLKAEIPRDVPPPRRKHPPAKIPTTVAELVANGTVLEIAPRNGGANIRFDFSKLILTNLAANKSINIQVDLRNPNPPAEIRVSGAVGPLAIGKIGQTRISGTFELLHGDLAAYKTIKGDLDAKGKFAGTLGRANVEGNSEIPNFELVSSKHSFGLSTEYHAIVDATRGNVTIQSATARFLKTTLAVKGTVDGTPRKTVAVDLDSRSARTEDLMRVFSSADPPSLKGPVTVHAHVILPPAHERFLERVRLDGSFSITDAEFTSSETQKKLDDLSARALGHKSDKRGSDSGRVSEQLKSQVQMRAGVATLSGASFEVPGASVVGGGSYNLLDEKIDLKGNLAMHASLSKAAGGVKGILLTPLDPFFKKGAAGSVLPIHITGTYKHPVFKLSLTK